MLMGVTALALLLLLAPDPVDEQLSILRRLSKLPYEQGKRLTAIGKLGRIGSEDSTRALEGLLEDPFGHVQDAAVSALIQLKRKSAEERVASLALLADFLQRRREPRTRFHLATALGLIGDRRAVPGLILALRKARDPVALEAIAQALARLGDERAFEPLKQRARRSLGRAACLRALGGFSHAAEAAWSYWKDGDDSVRAAIVDVLVQRKREIASGLEHVHAVGPRLGIALADALTAVRDDALARRRAAELLKHRDWRVRAAAIAGVVRLRDASLLPDLVEVLAREEGRLRFDAGTALRRLTGKDIGPDPVQWRAILPMAELPPPAAQEGAKEAKGAGTQAYFTLPVYSQRIAFVFDVSGSMRDKNKIQTARSEFAETAKTLRKDQRYDLFVLRFPLQYPLRPRLERAFGKLVSGKSRAAVAWLKKQEAKGGGALYDALLAAIHDDEVDTIYLLSDGVPSYGTVSRGWRIVQEIRRLHRWRRVVIHGIMLDDSKWGIQFMRDLAEATGG